MSFTPPNRTSGNGPKSGFWKPTAGFIRHYATITTEKTLGRYAKDNGGGDFTPAPAGTHVARCVRLVDIGTHHGSYQGEPTVRNQVIVMWELPNELIEVDGVSKPIIVSRFYTNSLSEKANLRKDLESWRTRPFTTEELLKFDLENVLGKPCMISVMHEEKNGKTKAKVTSVAALPKGTTCPPAANDCNAFWLDEFDQSKFEAFSDGIKKLIMESDEWKGRTGTAETAKPDDFNDDVPF